MKAWNVFPVWAAIMCVAGAIFVSGARVSDAIDRQTEALMSEACGGE